MREKRKKEPSAELRVMSKLVRGNTDPGDYFMVRDCANRILIATEDATMTAIIILNMSSGANDYESDVPRLIHDLKVSGYDMHCVVHLWKSQEKSKKVSIRNYVYHDNIYQIETFIMQY
jgi:hypothetical protein